MKSSNGLTKAELYTLGIGIIIIIIFIVFGGNLTKVPAAAKDTTTATKPAMDLNQDITGLGGASNETGSTAQAPAQAPASTGKNISTDSNIQIFDEKVGTGAEAKAGKTISVNYLGTLTNGTKFDSSYDRGQPFSFVIGAGQVIKGWDLGFAGMKVGGKRKLIITPAYGYGAQSIGSIPANSTLVFEVELLDVK